MSYASFGLREEPFGVTPDPRFFYESEQHREAAATLYYAIERRRGVALLVGRAGLGKTSVLVRLMELLRDIAVVAFLPHPYFDRTSALEAILVAVGIPLAESLAENHRLFSDWLVQTHRSGKTCVIIIDEAQNLDRDTLEAIRILSNYETSNEKLVQIILSGQLELAETLKRSDCEQIRQRLGMIASLQPLNQQDVSAYIEHRLREAACPREELFSSDAVNLIASESGGIPRNVNSLCFSSMTVAYALNRRQVNRSEVMEVLRDRDVVAHEAVSIRPDLTTKQQIQPARSMARVYWWATSVLLGLAIAALLQKTLSARTVAEATAPGSHVRYTMAPEVESLHARRHAVQVGAFRNYKNAERLRKEMQARYGLAEIAQPPEGSSLWRVLVAAESDCARAEILSTLVRLDAGLNSLPVHGMPLARNFRDATADTESGSYE